MIYPVTRSLSRGLPSPLMWDTGCVDGRGRKGNIFGLLEKGAWSTRDEYCGIRLREPDDSEWVICIAGIQHRGKMLRVDEIPAKMIYSTSAERSQAKLKPG